MLIKEAPDFIPTNHEVSIEQGMTRYSGTLLYFDGDRVDKKLINSPGTKFSASSPIKSQASVAILILIGFGIQEAPDHYDVMKRKYFSRYWPFLRQSTGDRWFPSQKAVTRSITWASPFLEMIENVNIS